MNFLLNLNFDQILQSKKMFPWAGGGAMARPILIPIGIPISIPIFPIEKTGNLFCTVYMEICQVERNSKILESNN